jgi:hypothetical protein
MRVYGNGTTLAEVKVNNGVSELVNNWFQERRKLPNPPSSDSCKTDIADAISKLFELHKSGALTDDEFKSVKQKLLNS